MPVDGREQFLSKWWTAFLLVLLGVFIPLFYLRQTDHVWEDYFITFRHSQNLVEGRGLLYNPGQLPVHGFTSPLGTLLPALCYGLTGRRSYLPALWLFRLFGLAAFVGGGLLVWRRLARPPARALAGSAFVLMYVLDVKAVAFSVNGMETGFMLLFVGWCILLWSSRHPRAWLARGSAWAGLLWTRPDGCVYIAAFALAEWVFDRRPVVAVDDIGSRNEAPGRGRLLGSLGKSAAVTTLLYLPWLLFAWSYYGSPVPQTIRAKAPVLFDYRPGHLLATVCARLPQRAASVFGPIYFPGSWPDPDWVHAFCSLAGMFCLVYWLLPVNDRLGRMASAGFTLLCAYLSFVALQFPWYYPPVAFCGLVVLARALVTMAARIGATVSWPTRSSIGLAFLAYVVGEIGLFGLTIRQIRIQQEEIETGHREQIGLWLRNRVRPGDAVFLEPLGYIGYFSGARMIDWPGLVSREVSLFRHQGLGYDTVIERLRPEWAVFRPQEAATLYESDPGFGQRYLPLKLFDRTARLEEIERHVGPIPGGSYLTHDAIFLIFKRKDSPTETASPDLKADSQRCREFLTRHGIGLTARPASSPEGVGPASQR